MTMVRWGTWVELEPGMYLQDPAGRPWLVDAKKFSFGPPIGWEVTMSSRGETRTVVRPADGPTRILEPSTEQAVELVQRILGGAVIQEDT